MTSRLFRRGIVVGLAVTYLGTAAGDVRFDEATLRDKHFAERSVAAIITYRVMTNDDTVDQLVREYTKILCEGRFDNAVQASAVGDLFPLTKWTGSLEVGCGCFRS